MANRSISRIIAALACASLFQPVGATAQNADAVHLAVWRKSTEFAYIRQYFPSRKIEFRHEKQMNGGEIKSSTAALTRAINYSASVARMRMQGIRVLLGNKMSSPVNELPGALKIDMRDDGESWFNNVPSGTVTVGPRTIRGLMKGSLQSLRVELPKSKWEMTAANASFFGSNLLGNDSATLTDDQWDARFATLMNVVEQAKIKSIVGTMWSAITSNDDDDDFDDSQFDINDADQYISRQKKMSLFVAMELGGALSDFSKHYLAAERFMLAHELGHLALGNNPTERTSCVDAQKAEDDADSFAIALLTMDDAAGTSVIAMNSSIESAEATGFFQGFDLRAAMGIGTDDYSVVYGYRDFTNFVYKAAEFSGQVTTTCAYRSPENRQVFIDQLRQTFYDRRKAALNVILQYYAEHPPILSVQVSGMGDRKDQLYAELGAEQKCAGVEQKRGSRSVNIDDFTAGVASRKIRGTEYFIKCKWPVPQPSILTSDQMALVGSGAWSNFVKLYAS